MTEHKPIIQAEIEPAPTPAQQAAWRELWGKLLSQTQGQQNEAGRGDGE